MGCGALLFPLYFVAVAIEPVDSPRYAPLALLKIWTRVLNGMLHTILQAGSQKSIGLPGRSSTHPGQPYAKPS